MEHVIRVGPAGWSYADWKGVVYPYRPGSKFDELVYLAQFFDTIEINSTFYRSPAPKTSRRWAERVSHNPQFKFTAKLYQVFTHDRGKATHADEIEFREGIEPLVKENIFGALLIQFPWSFKNNVENRDYLADLLKRLKEYPTVVEVRHASWNESGIYEWFHETGVGFCNIDQPLFSKSIKPSARSTSLTGYVRLHGRNYQSWFSARSKVTERYDYLYTQEELEPWLENIEKVADRCSETYVIANNHFRGKAVVNALEIKARLFGEKAEAPATLFESYPRLAESAVPDDQLDLLRF